ncbi:P-loop containing nucleoside triphosphate hydrolase protein, partial [Chytriomyces sp. MP71]
MNTTAYSFVTSTTSEGEMLSFKDISYAIPNRKAEGAQPLLDGINGMVVPGEVLAVMGPSGAGKSTFLDVIAGRHGRSGTVYGQVLLNGILKPMKLYSSYIAQDDYLLGSFTVKETVRWAVELNFKTTCRHEIDSKVAELLHQFGLVKVADTKVGDAFTKGISGGEKRRLSIAIQLVKEPNVIFLDEPTSGLDSAASHLVMTTIQQFARAKAVAVVCSIHQPRPSTYLLFDKVLFLARGRTVYFGPTGGADLTYFASIGHRIPAHMNVADAVLDDINVDFIGDETVAAERIKKFDDAWTASSDHLVTPQPCKRVENALLYSARAALTFSTGILMGTTWLNVGTNQIYVQSRFTSIFLSVGFLAFMSVGAIPALLEDREVFYRERLNRSYSVGAYVVANTIVSVPFIYTNTVLYHSWIFLNWIASWSGQCVTLLIAAVFPNFVLSLMFVAFFNALSMVTHGFLKYAVTIWNYQKWAWRAFMGNAFSGLTFQCAETPAELNSMDFGDDLGSGVWGGEPVSKTESAAAALSTLDIVRG